MVTDSRNGDGRRPEADCAIARGSCRDYSQSMALSKIVSGGQTGVDRGALDAALVAGFACGGWCPAHRGAEDGEIPERYPLTSLPLDFTARMRRRTQGREASQSHVFDSLSPGERTGEQHCCEHTDAMSGQVRSETMDGESVAV